MRSIVSVVVIVLVGLQAAPSGIDLTGVVPRDRVREPTTTSTSGGGVGGNGPVAQTAPFNMRILSATTDLSGSEPSVTFEVELKNVSDRSREFPVDPNLADFEPEGSDVPYRYLSSSITLRLEEPQRSWASQSVMLYGSRALSESIENLAPGSALRIRARAVLKANGPVASSAQTSPRVGAVFLLQQNQVGKQNGYLHQKSKQILPEVVSSNVVLLSVKP